jgi:integrase
MRFLAAFEAGWGKKAPPDQPTIGVILDGYAQDRKANTERPLASPVSLDAACAALRRHLADLTPEHLTRERCRLYARERRVEGHEVGPANARRRKPIGDGTVLRELGVLRGALAWAVSEKWIAAAPHVEGPPTPQPRDRWLTRQEATRLMAACGDFHVRVFCALALHTAARTGAILELAWDRVDLDRGRIDFGQGRGNKRRVRAAPITNDLAAVLRPARELAVSDFVVEFAGQRVGSVRTGFLAACRRAGLAGVTPHTLRHTAATWMAQDGASMWEIAGLLGNSVEVVTRTYAKHSPDHLRRAASAMDGVGGPPPAPQIRVRKVRKA